MSETHRPTSDVASIYTVRNDYSVSEKPRFQSERVTSISSAARHPILGALWALYGAMTLAGTMWVIVFNRTLTLMWGAVISHVANPFAWMNFFHAYLGVMVVVGFIAAALSFIAAFSLMTGAGARLWSLIAAAFGMFTTPIGIVLGVFTVAEMYPMRESR